MNETDETVTIRPVKLLVEGLTFDFMLPEKVSKVLQGMPADEAAGFLPIILADSRLAGVGEETLTRMRNDLDLMALSGQRIRVV